MSKLENRKLCNYIVKFGSYEPKIIKFIKKSYPLSSDEIIDSYIDVSRSCNGKKMIVFTSRGIHWKLNSTKGFVRYCDFSKLKITQKDDIINIQLNDFKLELVNTSVDRKILSDHLSECYNGYKEISSMPVSDFTITKHKKQKKEVNPEIGIIPDIFLIRLPYLLLFLGVVGFFLENLLLLFLGALGLLIFLISLPFRIIKTKARKRYNESLITPGSSTRSSTGSSTGSSTTDNTDNEVAYTKPGQEKGDIYFYNIKGKKIGIFGNTSSDFLGYGKTYYLARHNSQQTVKYETYKIENVNNRRIGYHFDSRIIGFVSFEDDLMIFEERSSSNSRKHVYYDSNFKKVREHDL